MGTLFTIEEAAKRLRISKSTVFRLLRSKKLKSLKVGNARRIEEEEIKDFIERHREHGEPNGEQKTSTLPPPYLEISLN